MSGTSPDGGQRRRGGNRGRSARRTDSAPSARSELTSEAQPMSGIEHEAVQEISGFWVGGKLGERYQVTNDWRVVKEDSRGTKTYDLFWDYDRGIVKWGDTFFFDPVDLYQSVDTLHWYRQSDIEKQRATHMWTRSQDTFEDFAAGKQAKPRKPMSSQSTNEQDESAAPRAPTSSSRKKAPNEELAVEEHRLVVQRADGGLQVKAGDVLRVVSVRGGTIILEAGPNGDAPESVGPQEGAKVSKSPAAKSAAAKPAAKMAAKAPEAKSAAKPGPSNTVAKGPPSTKPGKVAERAELQGTQPTEGDGADVLEFILGLWSGAKGETYNLQGDWSCTKTEKRGKETVFANLCWDEERGLILWGLSYMFDAADLEAVDETGQLDWYRQTDQEKAVPIFTWTRQEA